MTAHARAHLQRLLQQAAHAQARGHWLTPPGESAWDRLRAARALAPNDPDVRAATQAMGDAARECQALALRDNAMERIRQFAAEFSERVQRDRETTKGLSQVAYHARHIQRTPPAEAEPHWQKIAGAVSRLAERGLAVGDESLRGGDVAGARQALEHARQVDASVPGIAALAQRLQRVRPDLR